MICVMEKGPCHVGEPFGLDQNADQGAWNLMHTHKRFWMQIEKTEVRVWGDTD